MLAVADTALDLLVLELVLHGLRIGVGALVLGVLAPADARPENHVLGNGSRVGRRARAVVGTGAKLAPALTISHARVDLFRVRNVADAARRLDFLALVVDTVCDDGLGAVLVGDCLRRWQLGGRLLDIIIVGPVVPGTWWG
jgi:hypothetical protein